MTDTKQTFTTPVARVVGGSLYKPKTTDIEGKPLVYQHGANKGMPKVDFFVALAIAKGTEKSWFETPWGQLMLQVGAAAFPRTYQSPTFAWKVEDGDSQIPNGKGITPASREGYAGHWIIKTGGGYAPKTFSLNPDKTLNQLPVDAIKPGYYVQAVLNVDGNGSELKPGIKLYHSSFCLRAVHHEISWGPDASQAGYGDAALPAGISTVPPAITLPMQAGAPLVPVLPSAPVALAPSITAPAPLPVSVIPNAAFLQGAGVPAVPAAPSPIVPPVPAAPLSRVLTAKANGASYEALLANGWSDELLKAHGMMV